VIDRNPHCADVGKTPRIPPELTRSPFFLDEARNAGLTLSALSGKSWQRLGAELYRWKELPDDPWLTLSAWRRVLPPDAVFAGATAAWLFGLDLEPTDPVEVAVPPSSGRREVVSIRQLRATALPLTLAGLCLQRPACEALVAIDMAIHRGLIDAAALGRYAEMSKGRPGAARLRSLALLAAAAESPMETRLRWLLVQARLPQPEVQTNLRDHAARFVGRADLYYPAARLVLEYDGGNHRERMVDDNRRQNLLVNAGYRVLRFTSADIRSRADVVIGQVRAALASKARLVPDVSNR